MTSKAKSTAPIRRDDEYMSGIQVVEPGTHADESAVLSALDLRRTELEAVAEVSSAIASIRESDTLLQTVSDLTKDRFKLYHAHIYLLDPTREQLALAGGAGEAGIQMKAVGHRISANAKRSLVARAARTRQTVVVNDVTSEEGFLPNPLLPDTISELATPLILRDQVLGVLDVQATEIGRFGTAEIRVMSTLASQIAIAVENARAFEQVTNLLKDNQSLLESQQAEHQAKDVLARIGTDLLNAQDEIALLKAVAQVLPDPSITYVLCYLDMDDAGEGEISNVAMRLNNEYSTGGKFAGPYSVTGYPLTQLWQTSPDSPIFIEDVLSHPLVTESGQRVFTQLGARGMALVPLRTGGYWQGLWFAFWTQPHPFSEAEKELLSSIHQPLASAVKSRRTYVDVQTAERNASRLYELGKRLNAAHSEQELVTAIAETLAELPTAAVTFIEWDNDDYDTAIGFSLQAAWRNPDYNVPLAASWSRSVFPTFANVDRYNPIWSDDLANDSSIVPEERTTYTKQLKVSSRLTLPLIRNGKWFGNVAAYWQNIHHFNEAELQWWRTITDQVSLAFSRVILERQSERRAQDMESVAEVGAAITSIRNLEELLQAVSDLTKQRFNLYHAHIYLLNSEGNHLKLAAGAGVAGQQMKASGHGISMKAERSLVARAARTGQSVIVNNVTQELGFLPNPLLPATKSELATPLIIGDRVLGVLDVQSSSAGAFKENDIQVMSTLAAQVAIAIENARAFDRAQDLIQYNRTIISSVPDGLLITDPNTGAILEYNTQASQMLGYEEGFGDANFFKFTPPEWMEATRQALAQNVATNTSVAFEKEYYRKDGSRIPVRISFAYFTDPVTHHMRSVTIVTDRSAQRDEQRRKELTAQLSTALLDANDEVEILKASAILVPDPGVLMSLGYLDEQADGRLRQLMMVATRYGGQFSPARDIRPLEEVDRLTQVWQRSPNQSIFVSDATKHEGTAEGAIQDILLRANLHAAAVIPLRTGDQWLGVWSAYWAEPHVFTETEREMFNTSARLLASSVATRRAYLAEQEAEQEAQQFYQLTAAINNAQSTQTLLNSVVAFAAPPSVNTAQIMIGRKDSLGATTMVETTAHYASADRPNLSGTVRPIETFPVLARLDRSRVTWSEDVLTDVLFDPETLAAFEQMGVRSCVMIPMNIQNESVGTLALYSDQPTQYSERQIRVFETVARQASAVLERLSLQHQSEQRSLELETVAQVTTAAAALLNTTELLQTVADLTKQRFDLYHAHVYLLDEEGRYLVMTAGAGEPGRTMKATGHRIPLSRMQSLVAQAARTRTGVIADDVTREPNFMPNPLLPQTRSELAVPLVIGNLLIGVLDAQSDQVARFTRNDVFIFTTLADQIAVAVQNARLYEEQARTAKQLREVDQLKSEFLASMSHELRTPLNSIIGFSEVLGDGLDGDLPDEAKIDVDAIHESGQHLLELINDVLDLAKIEAGHMELDLESMALHELLHEVIHSSRVLIKDKPVELVSELQPDLPLITADVKRLRQILKNLVSNAIKFTEQGYIIVTAQPVEEGRFIQIDVQDTGVGIAPEHQKLVFERFRQVDNSLTRRVGGTGLGLPITRELVEMHGGKIWITSVVGHGSTFSFTIPTAAVSTETT